VKDVERSIAEDKEAGSHIDEEQQAMEGAFKEAKKALARATKESIKLQKEIKDYKANLDEKVRHQCYKKNVDKFVILVSL
jgi:soluble cytochrome b562